MIIGGSGLKEFDNNKRILTDRRRQPTPGLSRYTFFGRRRAIRRRTDQLKGGYVDWYSSKLLLVVVLIIGLNVLDALFTMMTLEQEGWELNPVVQAVIAIHGDKFWIWKFLIVSISLILLCLHIKFRLVKSILLGICVIYIAIILYQITLLI